MAEPPRILVVDDDPMFRRFVGALLANEGYEVREAEDGEAALRLAATLQPRLILLDLVLPCKDGFGVLHGLREDPATRRIPIMMLSVKAREQDVVKCLHLGAEDYMIKPFGTHELVARIGKILDRTW